VLVFSISCCTAAPAFNTCQNLASYYINCSTFGVPNLCCDGRYQEALKDMCKHPDTTPPGTCVSQSQTLSPSSAACKAVQTQSNFSVDAYLGRWFIQEQMAVSYLPTSRNYCVLAEYSRHKGHSILGWDLAVHNRDQTADGVIHDSTKDTKGFGLCAKIADGPNGKLEVAPCFLPPLFSGAYWIVHHDVAAGWALVVGGQPTVPTHGGLCKTGDGTNNSGLWILTRKQTRDEDAIASARQLAEVNGIDTSVLNPIDQSNCTYA